MRSGFSVGRLFAILAKEFIQMRRDRITFAMMLGVPIIQLMLFGFAINKNTFFYFYLLQSCASAPRPLYATFINGGVWAFWLASTAVNTIFCYNNCHFSVFFVIALVVHG